MTSDGAGDGVCCQTCLQDVCVCHTEKAFKLAAERWSQLPPLIRATVGDSLANLALSGMNRGRNPSTARRARVHALADMAWMIFHRLGIALTQGADDEAEKAGISLDVSFAGRLGEDAEESIAQSASADLAQDVDQDQVAEILAGAKGLQAFQIAVRETVRIYEEMGLGHEVVPTIKMVLEEEIAKRVRK